MVDIHAVPEQAIGAFERWTGLTVVVHDLGNRLSPYLRPDRFMHTQPLCAAMKRSQHGDKCFDFEVTRLRPEVGRFPDGRVHLCHAGLVQWVAPVFWRKQLEWVLFAGQRRLGTEVFPIERDPTPPPQPSPWSAQAALPPTVSAADSELYLEGLRQLAARLRQWLQQIEDSRIEVRDRDARAQREPQPAAATRTTLIRRFLQVNHPQPVALADLAAALHLSVSRTAHLVQQLCGATFVELLTAARLRTAASLLRHSNLKIPEIARQSGFGDVSFFHRCFKKAMGMTPHRYRRNIEQPRERGNFAV